MKCKNCGEELDVKQREDLQLVTDTEKDDKVVGVWVECKNPECGYGNEFIIKEWLE